MHEYLNSERDLTFAEQWSKRAIDFLPRLGSAALLMAIFFGLSLLVMALVRKATAHLTEDRRAVAQLLLQTSRFLILGFGLVTALGTLGINVSALVAGLGLTGFALAFALKDAVSNILAGCMVMLYRPFHVGDHIEVTALQGKVTRIDLRYTELVNDTQRILIPNGNLLSNPITIHSSSPTAAIGSPTHTVAAKT